MTTTLMSTHDLIVGYGKLAVARHIDLELEPGSITAVLGPNGAGKTSLLLTLAGFIPALGGHIELDGSPVKRPSAQKMNQSGVVLVPDSRSLFNQLTPLENLRLGSKNGKAGVDAALDLFPGLRPRVKIRTAMLSGGEQQMLAVARALVQEPRVLLIDEMSMGLAPVIVEQLVPIVRRVADETNAAVLLVEQHVRLALEVADRAVVLVHGDVVLDRDAAELRQNASLLENAYLGGAAH
ncbi:MAG: ABC transporter ATP-binding protein [Actinomycetota bacterium]|nr:ABC transporter ATP-binding protein [Actinomycetota bacterium]